MNLSDIEHFSLGQKTSYPKIYNPDLLVAIPRSLNREKLNLEDLLPFKGYDLWNCYEISFLNMNGLPVAALCTLQIPCTTDNLVESKSLKLYLNSFNFTKIRSLDDLKSTVHRDLTSKLSPAPEEAIQLEIYPLSHSIIPKSFFINSETSGCGNYLCLEQSYESIEIDSYDYNPNFLIPDPKKGYIKEKLCSNLLKSNCLVTQQPDWGSVYIHYEGQGIDHENLLKYIVSFRNHNEFHEMCVERIFTDITNRCHPDRLTVFARYTRRGGIDINPFRSNFETSEDIGRTIRQ